MNRIWKRIMIGTMAAVLMAGTMPAGKMTARADLWDTSNNDTVKQTSVSRGKIGKSMNVTVDIYNNSGSDWADVYVNIENPYGGSGMLPGPGEDHGGMVFPFEKVSGKSLGGGIANGKHKSVSIPAQVRSDLVEGYYQVEVVVYQNWSTWGDSGEVGRDYVNIYVTPTTAGDNEDPEDVNKQISFSLGEGQATPYGVYPNVLNFAINMRNSGLSEARDVTVEMVLDKDSEIFPFDINDGSYDRYHEVIAAGEAVQLPYSMAIREDTYSGFYELKFKIHYRESATGDMQEQEESFWVRIKNKEREEDKQQATGEHANSVARIVVDSFETRPDTIISGEDFQLVLRMKNASSDIPASNILLSLESETSSTIGGAVFTTQSGSSSYVINSLQPEESSELILDMHAAAGVDQRTYYMKIQETYDSPEYKNATAEISINIPVRQVARLNTGTIDVMPADISVGAESNIMFPINNTGKVLLYNVTVAFEADSIVPTDTYVGNIKPGETGNVDVMLTGAAGTTDDGKVKIIITYEDENGEVQEPVEKELTLMVTEFSEEDYEDAFNPDFDVMPEEEPKSPGNYLIYLAAAAVIVGGIIGGTLFVKSRKKKKEHQDDLDDIEG